MVHRRFVPPFRAVLQPRTHRIDNAGKFEEQTVARGFDDATTVFLDLGIGQLASYSLKRSKCALLVLTHQPRVTGDIRGKNGSQPTFDASRGQSGAPNRMGRMDHRFPESL